MPERLPATGRTHYRLDGPTAGPAVVLVPGATLPMFVWDGLADALATGGHRVLRYDLLGRGGSAAPRIAYGADAFDGQLAELVDAVLPDRPVHLVSLAFGALIAARFADLRPDRVASLTYLAPDGFGVAMSPAVRLMRRPVIGEALMAAAGSRMLLKRLDDYADDPELVHALRSRFRPHVGAPGFQRAVLSSMRHMPVHDAAPLFRRSEERGIPALVLSSGARQGSGASERSTACPTIASCGSTAPSSGPCPSGSCGPPNSLRG